MNEFVFTRVIHVLAVVLWIGCVAMVTTVLLPAIRALTSDEEKLPLFERIESRFSLQAKATTLLTGLSGFYMCMFWTHGDGMPNPDSCGSMP